MPGKIEFSCPDCLEKLEYISPPTGSVVWVVQERNIDNPKVLSSKLEKNLGVSRVNWVKTQCKHCRCRLYIFMSVSLRSDGSKVEFVDLRDFSIEL